MADRPRLRSRRPRRPRAAGRLPAPARVLAPVLAPVLAAVLLAGCSADATPSAQLAGTVHAPYAVPAVTLTDTAGDDVDLTSDLANGTDEDLTLVFFGYSHCPDICQTVLGTMAAAMSRLEPEDRERVQVVFVTTDPARDTPAALRDYLDRFDPSFEGLTGDLDDIVAAGEPLAVYVADGEALPTGGRDLDSHSSQISGVTPDGTSPILWPQEVSAAELAGDVAALLGPDADRLLEEGLR